MILIWPIRGPLVSMAKPRSSQCIIVFMKKKERIQFVKNRIRNSHFNFEQLFCLTIYLLIFFISKHFCEKDAAHTRPRNGWSQRHSSVPANVSVDYSSLTVCYSWEIHCSPD